jgi:acetyltransferase-like isoleucine patch superfamily enzyme
MMTYVNKDVEPNVFTAGIPARIIKKLTKEDLMPKKDIEITRYNKK